MTRLRGEIPTAEALGRMLQQGRLVRGMSQRELADRLGIGQKWVWEMEGGKPGIFTARLFEILRATGVHLYAEIDRPSIRCRAAHVQIGAAPTSPSCSPRAAS